MNMPLLFTILGHHAMLNHAGPKPLPVGRWLQLEVKKIWSVASTHLKKVISWDKQYIERYITQQKRQQLTIYNIQKNAMSMS